MTSALQIAVSSRSKPSFAIGLPLWLGFKTIGLSTCGSIRKIEGRMSSRIQFRKYRTASGQVKSEM
jgi:hypothetical protein